MSVAALAAARPERPYPGLRPFEAREWPIFFGRERMIDEVIERLARDCLVVIHGASGSGKSSLVRAGVMPKLARQHMRHGAPWLTCALRPSGGPLWNLAAEFATLEGRADELARIESIHGLFNRRNATLASVAGALEGLPGKSLCVLVDQFEELFRYEKETSREAAELFVDLIGRVAAGEPSPENVDVHVVVTMRSEFLGECARFAGLAETINRTQYLVPRMDDDALTRAVRRPAQMFNGLVPEALAERLIASVRGREDELPLLQHGLMLMWEDAAGGKPGGRVELDGALVEAAGGLAELLSRHADRVMDEAAPDARRARLVEAMFRELTDVNAEGSAIRRPRSLRDLAAVADASSDELRPLIDAFRAPSVSFLTPYSPALLNDHTIVDISHEALIRCWRRIASEGDGWLKRELDDGLAWRSLLVEARAFENDARRVLSAAATEDRSKLFAERGAPWSRRYGGGWPLVGNLLEVSRKTAARARRWDLGVKTALAALTIGAVAAAALSLRELREAQQATAVAELQKTRAEQWVNTTYGLFDLIQNASWSSSDNAAERKLFATTKLSADKGNANAQNMLGLLYANGIGAPKDYSKAREAFEKSARAGYSAAMVHMGAIFQGGDGVPQDYGKALEWYERAAEAGDSGAPVEIGLLYANGNGVPRDYDKALRWYEKGADAGDANAMRNIGVLYENGSGVPPDYAKALDWYEKALDAGYVDAMTDLGRLYDYGRGVPRDYAKARGWYERAAAAGEADAMNNLAFLYENGHGVSQDYAKAREWFEKAAAAGNADAMNYLGALYENGQGVTQDYAKAREWYEKAAATGNAGAMNHLGFLYENGHGVSQDYAKAREWFEKAVAAGNADAMNYLGVLYENGQGVTQDYAKAREWFEKAVAAGNADAMNNLGLLYEYGRGVPQDYAKAREWFEKAAAAGNAGAAAYLGDLLFAPKRNAIAAARGSGKYGEALRLQESLADEIEANEVKTDGKPGYRTAIGLNGVSWEALFAREFPRALSAAERAHALEPNTRLFEANHAHALMFLGRLEEARALYLANPDELVPEMANKPWRQIIAQDFADLRNVGLANPLMSEIEAALAAKAQ